MSTLPLSVSQRATDVRSRRPQSKIGQLALSAMNDVIKTVINENPQADQVSTFTITGATNSKVYTVTVNDVEISYTADGTATIAEITDGLAAAINVEPRVYGQVSAESDGVDDITLTGSYPGLAFTISDSDAQIDNASITAAGTADSVPFGRGVICTSYQTDEANQLGILVASTVLADQVDTLTIVYAAAEVYYLSILVDGATYDFGVVASVDTAGTCTAIAAAINAQMPASTVIADGSSGTTVVLTAEVAGKAFSVTSGTKSGTASRLVLVHTTATLATDISKCLAGVSLYTTDESNLTVAGDDVVYPANAGVIIVSRGQVWVSNSESPSYGDDVYIGTGTSEKGMFYKSAGTNRILLPQSKATWIRSARSSSGDDLAVLQVNIGQ